jgi:antitoxin (DNA-binding transcriptional repressor) of toxin-antitoxin stability system
MEEVTVEEARARLPDLIDAALRGERVAIATEDQQVVQLVPVATRRRKRQFGSARGLIVMADDFDAPLTDFVDYRP